MNELKFRAITPERNTAIYFTLQDLINPKPQSSIHEILFPWLREGNIPDRYIGFIDKNRIEIYESDIVKCTPNFSIREKYMINEFVSKVYFAGAGFHVKAPHTFKSILLSECIKLEVVGNIYEDPELLKEVKE